MSNRLKPALPLLAGIFMMLTLTGLLIKVRYDNQIDRETTQAQQALTALAGEVSGRLNRATVGTAEGWHQWQLSQHSYLNLDGSTPVVPEAALGRSLERADPDGSTQLLGPFATESGDNAIAIAVAKRDGGGLHWSGSTATLESILPAAQIALLMRQGYRVQLLAADGQTPLYQTDAGELAAPVVVEFRFGLSRLQMRAAPRGGWRLPLRWWTSSLLLVLAVAVWLSYEHRRGTLLRDAAADLAQSESRRKQANLLYGQAIEHVASLESRLQIVSMYDTVTGLANRSSLLKRIDTSLQAIRQSNTGSMALLAIGFDHVHHITNSFGADFASRVLVVAAERIEFVLPARDLLFRIGDFHLAVVLPHADDGSSDGLAEKIINEIEAPIALDSHTFLLHPSVGIAEVSSGYEYPETLLDHANAALGAVHRDSLSRYCKFDSSTAKEAVGRLQLEVDLNRAFEEGQFILEYEPIVMPVTNAIAGFEALIRWEHPTEGRIFPGRFVPIAIQAGMSHRLNHWVMREAARQAAAWRRTGYQNLFINFNLSAEAFLRPQLDEEVGEILAEFDLPGHCLVLELTESALIQDLRAAARILNRLSELGMKAWLDDFGTGYSSLSYLRALPLRGVKIDRSFVERTVLDARDFGFLKSLIDLISYLGMQSIAEGIETREQYELLCMTTCDLYQGYHFARSMSAAQAERWMEEIGGTIKQVRRA